MKYQFFLTLLLISAGVTGVYPQINHKSISFDRARELIIEGNCGLKAAQTDIDAAQAGIEQAGVRPNPSAAISFENFGINEFEITAEQIFELGGKRHLRIEAASKEKEAIRNSYQSVQSKLEVEMVRRFIPIATIDQKLQLIDSTIAVEESALQQIQRRIDAGVGKRADLLRAEIEIERLRLDRIELERDNTQARYNFAALGGLKDSSLLMVKGALDNGVVVPSLEQLLDATHRSPLITADAIETARLGITKKVLKAEAAPDIAVSAGFLRNSYENENAPVIGISMEIPLYNRNTAAQRQVELQQKAVTLRKDNTLRQMDAEILDLSSRVVLIDKKIALLESTTIPKAGRVYDYLQEYYLAGNAGFVDLAQSRSQLLELQIELLDMGTQRAGILADLMQITSLPIQIIKPEK